MTSVEKRQPFTSLTWKDKLAAVRLMPKKQAVAFACDCARLVLPVWEKYAPDDKRPRLAIEAAEQWVLFDGRNAAAAAADAAARAAARAADAAADAAAYAAADAAAAIDTLHEQTLRKIDSRGVTVDIKNMAARFYEAREIAVLPVLADALEEAGHEDAECLLELRSGVVGLSHGVLFKIKFNGE